MWKLSTFILILTFSLNAHAYRMPEYRIDDVDWDVPAEEVFARFDDQMHNINDRISIVKLENYRRDRSTRFSRTEGRLYKDYLALKVPHRFWRYVVDLKSDLIQMSGKIGMEEADLMAKKIIQKLYDLSNEYKVAGSALINNLLVNMKVKDKGFCYQYTDALRKMLEEKAWRHFDFHWGAAYDKTWLENNGLVITAKGKPFETGIVIDPWRTASRPYWNRVKGDRYPWKELKDVVIAEEKSTLPTPAKKHGVLSHPLKGGED